MVNKIFVYVLKIPLKSNAMFLSIIKPDTELSSYREYTNIALQSFKWI